MKMSSPMLATGPSPSSIPTANPTTLESTPDDIMKRPTSQVNDPGVTPSLISPTSVFETPEPTIIPETPTICETPMDRTPAPPSAQSSADHRQSERTSREVTPPNRRRHAQNRLAHGAKTISKLPIFEGSEDEDKDEEPTDIIRSISLRDRPRSKDRREVRASSEDPCCRHTKKVGPRKV